MPRGRVRSFLQEVISARDVSDVQIDEEDMGDLVEKIYQREGEVSV
jgi:ABC-type uncharacterized transport system ATPase subunit